MKKANIILLTFSLILILVSCGSKIKVSDTEEFRVSRYRINVESAQVEDNKIEVKAKWSFGSDEDSTKQENFMSTGVLLVAEQSGKTLKEDYEDANMYTNVYETNEGHIYPKFELINEKDPIKLTFYSELSGTEKTVEFKLK